MSEIIVLSDNKNDPTKNRQRWIDCHNPFCHTSRQVSPDSVVHTCGGCGEPEYTETTKDIYVIVIENEGILAFSGSYQECNKKYYDTLVEWAENDGFNFISGKLDPFSGTRIITNKEKWLDEYKDFIGDNGRYIYSPIKTKELFRKYLR